MKVFKARNKALTMEVRSRASLAMYNNQIVQYKALLIQCEKDYDLMINVRLYQEIVVPFFNLKHGQFAAVALTRSGANKILVQNQRKFDTQFQAAQLSARQQIDKRIDENLAGLDAKVKSIIKETATSQYIKKSQLLMINLFLRKNLLITENNLNRHLAFNNRYLAFNASHFKETQSRN